jgi:hypothetical protein
MKIVLPTSPVFTPGVAGVGTLNFTTNGLASTFEVKRVFAVINQTRNSLIFAETVANVGYTSFNATTKIMTLQADTSACSSGDTLQVIYDDPAATVGITSLPSIPAGSNSIGTVVLGAGSAAIGTVGVTGNVEVTNDVGNAIPVSATALTDGNQKTQVTSLPSIPAGTNSIGTVVLGAGSAAVGNVGVSSLPSIPTGSNSIGTVVLGAGSAAVGNVGVSSLPSIPTGSNTIGNVNVLGGNATAVKTDSSGVTQPVSLASILNVAPTVLTVAGAYSGTTITIPTNTSSLATFVVEAAGLWSGTLIIESTLDGSNWFSVSMVDLRAGTPTTTFPSRPADNIVAVACSVAGFSQVRIRSSTFAFAGTGSISYGFSEKVVSSSSSGSAGGSVTVSNFPATQAVSGSVSVSGNVEITNDVGNAIPVSVAALPLPLGASTEATLLAIKNAYLNGTLASPSLNTTFPSFSFSCSNSGCVVFYITGTFNSGSSFYFESSVDSGLNYITVPFVNLVTGASATSVVSTGASISLLVAVSAVGISNMRVSSSGSLTTSTLAFKLVTSEKTVSAAAGGAASSVSVTNFPATQPVSGTVSVSSVSGTVSVSGIVQEQANVGLGNRCSLGNGSLVGQGINSVYAYGWEIAVENNDTGYGLEPIYIKVFASRSSGGSLIGAVTPDYIITVCDGVNFKESGIFPVPLQWGNGTTTLPWFFATRNKADNDVTFVSSLITFTLYNRSTNY